MNQADDASYALLKASLAPYDQLQVLAFWDELSSPERLQLASQIRQLDLDLLRRLFRAQGSEIDWGQLAARATAPPAFRLQTEHNRFTPQQARARGEAALRAGELGVLLVAGGQGTRLNFDHPKGMFPIGPISEASLFQLHIEKLQALTRRYGCSIPLYLMTSPATHEATLAYLEEQRYFGLPQEELTVFCQGTMPAVDAQTGKLLLEGRDQLFLSPDGHGGTLSALKQSGALEEISRRGLKHLFYFQVDNPLAPICDPEFIGYHLLAGSELSTLAVAKKEAEERVGNIVAIDGRVQIIEYSDLPDESAQRQTASGALELWAGNTAIHVFAVDFLNRVVGQEDSLPFHVAKKAVPHVDPVTKRPVEPKLPNALKFERFIFDLLPAAQNAIVVEADAAVSFAPLKNASGAKTDTPEAVRAQMIALHRGWLESAGAAVAPGTAVEISPLFALDAEETAERVRPGERFSEPTYFHLPKK